MVPMKQVTILMVVGGILVVLCGVFVGVFPVIFQAIVNKMLVVKPDGKTIDDFISPPVPIYMQFYLFNVTNPDEIRFRGEKPIVTQVGPYTYEEVRTKHNMTWDDEEGTVTYLQDKSFFFNEEMSNGLLETDKITTINAIMVVIADFFSRTNSTLLDLIWTEIEAELDLFESYVIGDMIFYGFPLPEFNFDFSNISISPLNETEGLSGTLYDILTKLYEDGILDNPPPESLASNEINFMKNHTDDKTYKVKTGAKGLDDYLNIVEWDGEPSLSYWANGFCNMINGTDGTQYPPEVTKDRILYLYTSELCRSLYLTYEEDRDFLGIHTMKFIPPKEVLEDPQVNPDNLCYCYPDTDHCLGASMLNMAPCVSGAPVILSTPHFYQGNEEDIQSISGLNPNKLEHETFLDIEPKTGVAMRANKKMQINVPLRRYGSYPTFQNVPEVIFPVVWVNESAQLDESMAKDIKKAIYMPFTIVDAVGGVLIGIGGILLLVGSYKFIRLRKSRSHQKI